MLNSIVTQNFRDFEVIIVDGGSRDQTKEVALSYSQVFPLKIVDGTDNPIGLNRNLGGYSAKGNVLIFTEGDCFLKAGLLKKIDEIFSDPTLAAWSSSAFPSKSPWFVMLTYKIYDLARYLLTRFRLGFSVSGSIIVVRKNVFLKISGFAEEITMNDDGILGRKIYDLCKEKGTYCIFCIDPKYSVVRSMTRFDKGFFQAMNHYIYVIANFIPILKPLFQNRMLYTGKKFLDEGR